MIGIWEILIILVMLMGGAVLLALGLIALFKKNGASIAMIAIGVVLLGLMAMLAVLAVGGILAAVVLPYMSLRSVEVLDASQTTVAEVPLSPCLITDDLANRPDIDEATASEHLAVFRGAPIPEYRGALPQQVTIETAEDQFGNLVLRVEYQGNETVSISLFRLEEPDIESQTINYSASIRSFNSQKSYLEMHCHMPNNNTYFSRAQHEAVQGTQDWRKSQTPFFFQSNERPEAITLGVRMEGQGIIEIRAVMLEEIHGSTAAAFAYRSGWFGGILGASIGILGGVYGVLAGWLPRQGRGKAFLMAFVLGMVGVSAVLLIAGGIIAISRGFAASYEVSFPLLLCGVIGVVVFTPQYYLLGRLYVQAELRKMAARDI